MKVLVGKFVLESNENIPMMCDIENVQVKTGADAIANMQMGDVLQAHGVEVIPSLYADAASSGVMRRSCFEYLEGRILQAVREHVHEIDGIYLHLHGASEVEGLGSGDHHILREVRKICGRYLPIAVACDPHGNLCQSYCDDATIIRSYRESPHTDIEETIAFVLEALVDQIEHPTGISCVYRKLPLILGGEQTVSADEPVRSINAYLDELETDERILSASWHVGYIRHDTDVAGCGIVVVPSAAEHRAFAEQKADELASFVWERRHEFHYTGTTAEPDEALAMALAAPEGPAFVTDSGDNVTSGSTGSNTFILRQALALPKLQKRMLFAAIHDKAAYARLATEELGATVDIQLGAGFDELSAPVPLAVRVLAKGRQEGTRLFGEDGDFGGGVRVAIEGTTIEIIVTDTNHPFVEPHQMEAFGAAWADYDVIVVKTGYAFPEVVKRSSLAVMSLTDGPTLQDTSRLPFKRIMRPMFPIDNI